MNVVLTLSISGEKRSWGRRMVFAASIALHGAAAVALVVYSFVHIEVLSPPVATLTFFSSMPPPPPPPPARHKAETKPRVVTKIVQPTEIPKLVQPAEAPPTEEPAQSESDEGVEGGVEGGVPGGVLGGTVNTAQPVQTYERVSHAPQIAAGERQPSIPPSLLQSLRGFKGVVLVKVRINASGEVDSVEIVRSTIPMLDEIVKRHIKANWRFEPPLSGGRAVAVEFLQPFSFAF